LLFYNWSSILDQIILETRITDDIKNILNNFLNEYRVSFLSSITRTDLEIENIGSLRG
jgi:hypothetical protein